MRLKKIILLSMSVFVLTGCISIKTGSKVNVGGDGGFYRSSNRGADWAQKTLIPTVSGKPNTFADSNYASMAIDPSDENTIYFGTEDYGMLYTYDAGESWFVAKSLGQNTVWAIAVDPKDHCTIYAAVKNALKKSTDCARTWETKFALDDDRAYFNNIVIDHANSSRLYIATSKGGLYKSTDGGNAWNDIDEIVNFRNRIVRLVMSPTDSRHLYVLFLNYGVYRSFDAGATWEEFGELNRAVEEFKLGGPVIDLQLSASLPDFYLAATNDGLLRTNNRGGKWEKVDIVTPEKKSDISAIAFNPRNEQELYYATVDTFYRSVNGGKSWSSERVIAGSRSARSIIVHPKRGEVLYVAAGNYKEEY